MFALWRFAAAALGVLLLGTACTSSGTSSTAAGGQSSVVAGSTPAAGPSSPAVGVTPPVGSSLPVGGGGGCKLSSSQVGDIVGTTFTDGQPNGNGCTYVTADGSTAVVVVSTPLAADEEGTITGLQAQYADLKPIPGEDHAYAADSVGQVWLFANDQLILVGSSNVPDAKALAIAKAYAG
jgi:hypothetical protein